MKRSLILLILMMFSAEAVSDVVVGVFPRRSAVATMKLYTPLVKALSKEFQEKFHLEVAKDFKTFWKGVKNRRYDLVHFNQYHYIRSHKQFGYSVLVANEEYGSRKIAGMLAVRKDSNINSLQDLRGKTIVFGGGKKAMVAYIAPTALLKQAGLVEGRDYSIRFTKNPPAALVGVHNKITDAAGAGNIALDVMRNNKIIDVSQLKVLAVGDEFVHLPWAASNRIPKDKRQRIQDFMVRLKHSPEGRKVLKAARLNGFYAVEDKEFGKIRKITEYVLGEKY